ncbi:hypothetical protein [Conexibacter sp. DBS9H8]|uniref:hypothetical protein n=1 Tax=Conexibacter sp. DBS9H8 TaxID=2937801 RepID=UPI00200E9829|nr:hypothetical protein [Conexibacter sp. DBS9H8]
MFRPTRIIALALILLGSGAAIAAADGGPPPDSSIYMQHPGRKVSGTVTPAAGDNVIIVFRHATGTAQLQATNTCLGTVSYPGAAHVPDAAVLNSIAVHHDTIHTHTTAMVYTSAHGGHRVKIILSVRLTPARASGTVTFPGTRCHRIVFTARLVQRT